MVSQGTERRKQVHRPAAARLHGAPFGRVADALSGNRTGALVPPTINCTRAGRGRQIFSRGPENGELHPVLGGPTPDGTTKRECLQTRQISFIVETFTSWKSRFDCRREGWGALYLCNS